MTQDGTGRPLLLSKQRNSKAQGDIGLAIAIAWFAQNGYRVSIPLTDSQDYDLVVEYEGHFHGVQVKTTYHRRETGNYLLNLRVTGGNRSGTGRIKYFNPDVVDYLFVVTDMGEKYFIPSSAISARNAISLCDKYAEYRVT
jgi:hypothetical protein